jgi:hypothetical protein
MDVIKTLES